MTTWIHHKMKIYSLLISCLIIAGARAQPGTSWTQNGPIQFPTNVSGQINGIGRCTQLKFDPVNAAKMYATTSSGGLWMTSDTGSTWSNLGTDYFPNVQCASICIDNTNSNTLYLGTGDPNYYSNGLGVYKSTNGGLNWFSSSMGINTGLIIELIMDPTNNQNILAATDNGIFKTTNAGSSWSTVKNGGDFKAMVLKPNSKDTVYAVTSSEVWRSLDFGTNWTQITAGVSVPNNNGLGMRLAVSSASANVVFVGMIANGGLILQSTDFGTTYSTVYNNSAQSLVGYDAVTPGQGDYNFAMTLDPSSANTVYVAAHCVWKSIDGGVTWSKLTNWYADCHTDMHGIRVHPTYPNMLFDVNDGGVFLSRDGGTTWVTKSDGMAATEIYHAAQSNITRSQVSIGTQDNGELFMAGNVLTGNAWYTNGGGDLGSRLKYSYSPTNEVYYYDQGNRRTVNGSQTTCNFPFNTFNSMEIEFNRKIPNVSISGLQSLYTCTNLSAPTPSWSLIFTTTNQIASLHSSLADSSVIYALYQNNTLYRCDNIFAASPVFVSYTSPGPTNVAASIASIASNSNVVYVSCGSSVYRSSNKGQSFTSVSSGLPTGINIIKLYHDEYSSDESIYLCTAKGVYYKNNTMTNWQNISYNLPTIADIQDFLFYNTGNAASLLRVGYYGRGVWELPINVSQPPAASFTSNKQAICAGSTIQFTNLTISTSSITSLQWNFTGGTPATSTSQNPTIVYSTPGSYPVTLTASNVNGSGSVTVQAYIQVMTPQAMPIVEGFAASFPPYQWAQYDDGQDNVIWNQSLSVGGYNTSSQSTYFDNYDNDVNGKRDELITKTYDFSGVTNPVLWFDVAFARWGPAYSDSLMVLASTNCGLTYSPIYYKGGTTLSTAPDDQNYFTPTATQWRTETVNLSAFAGLPSVWLAFQNRGHYGNVIYLDNINLFNEVAVDAGISAILSPTTTGCYSSNTSVIVAITNYGTSQISNVPVTAVVSGTPGQTLTATYSGGISPATSVNFNFGSVNMSTSGIYTFSVYTGLSGDGNAWNDQQVYSFTTAPLFSIYAPAFACLGNSATLTIVGTAASYVWAGNINGMTRVVSPSATTVYSVTGTTATGCASSKTVTLAVQNPTITSLGATFCSGMGGTLSVNAFTPSTVNWFSTPSSTVSLATGSTLSVNPVSTTIYYAEAISTTVDSLFTTLNAGYIVNGSMFDITALNAITIDGLSMHFSSPGSTTVEVWYRSGTFVGFESSTTGWTQAFSSTVSSLGAGILTPITGTFAINVSAGQTYGLYVTCTTGQQQVNCSGGTGLGNLYTSNADLQLFEGKSGAYFNVLNAPRVFNGLLQYQKKGCASPKIAVQFSVTPSPTVNISASSTSICAGESVTLTAIGAADYTWTPGGIPTASFLATPGQTTLYTVIGTLSTCTTSSSTLIAVDLCTGLLSANLVEDQIDLYPNPNTGNFTVRFKQAKEEGYALDIYDLTGRVVYKVNLKSEETALTIKELANGAYNYKIRSLVSGQQVKTGKLVKQ